MIPLAQMKKVNTRKLRNSAWLHTWQVAGLGLKLQ